MDVHVVLCEPLPIHAELLRVRPNPRTGGLRRLLHHLAELAGDRQPALAGIRGGLDEEDVAADGREGEPGCDAGIGRPLAHVRLKTARAEPGAHATLVDAELLRGALSLRELPRGLAEHVRQPALEAPDTGLARVLANHEPERVVGDRDAIGVEPGEPKLLRHKVLARDPELLVLRVPRGLADVQSVE